jgi:hypothetical protein
LFGYLGPRFTNFVKTGVEGMWLKNNLAGLAVGTSLLIVLASSCSMMSSTTEQPPPTGYMQKAVGTPNELSPMAPGNARNLRKVGDHWVCEVNGKTMVYNSAASCWEPQHK